MPVKYNTSGALICIMTLISMSFGKPCYTLVQSVKIPTLKLIPSVKLEHFVPKMQLKDKHYEVKLLGVTYDVRLIDNAPSNAIKMRLQYGYDLQGRRHDKVNKTKIEESKPLHNASFFSFWTLEWLLGTASKPFYNAIEKRGWLN